jgi:iron complex transport system ATP-binding protein
MLRANNILVRRSKTIVLNDVTVQIPQGVCCGIIGANGAGKSTLLMALSSALPLANGSVTFHDHDVARLAPQQRARHIAYMSQSLPTVLSLSVLDYVVLHRYCWHSGHPKESDYELARHWIEYVGIGAIMRRQLPTLSGGQLQKVRLACALAQVAPYSLHSLHNSVLLLDEPTAAFDLPSAHTMLHAISTLTAVANVTVILCVHDLTLALRYTNQCILLHHGQVLAHASTAAVINCRDLSQAYSAPIRVFSGDTSHAPYVDAAFLPLH